MASTSLQIPYESSAPGPSSANRYQPSSASRPVSVSAHPAASAAYPSSRRQQRASHTVVSSQQQQDEQPAYHDVYSHPAAAAYASAHPRRTIPKFGPYLLLQTLGEGEFGKVKLGLHSQWGEEVAVKLMRRGNVDSSVKMSKVEREIEVLRTLKHPNIVRLYDVIETDKYIGIILEYASGGELFDHILAHRYLKEKDAAKLFSQLISGVWYIHQKKIVHRDLKLENLLLDRHRNILITDFGFANRFEHRSDDLMQTSCGSPCYAAPELVISEGLYVGSAVDIWSCGVILYAMLAGYLPFDDDPANPDGDNINLLYKYIVNTPLSFPDYISEEARDLLSMMLVPDPKRRADLGSVMRHPWLGAYAVDTDNMEGEETAFGKTVEELEQIAMEQHQLKRLAYQRQMRAVAAAQQSSMTLAEPSRAARSQSQRVDSYGPTGSGGRSHSTQPEYLYETSADQSSLYPTLTPPSARRAATTAVDDDPFAPPGSMRRAPPTDDDSAMQADLRASSTTRRPSSRDDTPTKQIAPSPDTGKKKSARHTIQVEYDEPSARTQTSPRRSADRAAPVPAPAPMAIVQPNGEKRRRPSQSSVTKPLPLAPVLPAPQPAPQRTPSVSSPRERTSSRVSPVAVRSAKPPPADVPVDIGADPTSSPISPVATSPIPPPPEDRETVSQSSKGSRHRKGASSIGGLGKIFGTNGTEEDGSGVSSRVPSDGSASIEAPSQQSHGGPVHRRPSTLQPPAAQSSATALLSPGTGEAKKSRRNTLTVMVEPISRSIRSRTKGRLASAAVADEEKRERERAVKEEAVPQSAVTPVAPERDGMDASFTNASRTDIGIGMQASTNKARKVMQWFRSKSKARDVAADGVDLTVEMGEKDIVDVEREQVVTPTQAAFKIKNTSSHTINQSKPPVQVVVTTPNATSPQSAGSFQPIKPSRTPSASSTDASVAPSPVPKVSGFANRIRNSVTVGGSSNSHSSNSGSSKGGMLRIHHGAVDQTTITTRAPPEVMKHVRAVLDGMGVEIQLESEYKYRCIRPKRKKLAGEMGSVNVGASGTGLAAFTMMGSAASNGVDKRGLPVPSPSSFHGTGGMLRGLLMRRQSSQVSTSGLAASQASYDDETGNTSPIVTEPSSLHDVIYGDHTSDIGDEVRFSVELTRLDRLNDTFSLDIRRLKGNLRSYKFLYDTLRERADLQR